MKTVLIKIATIFLSIVLITVITVNSWMLFITYKLSESSCFLDRITVMSKYKVFQHAYIGAYSMVLSVILLVLMLWFVFKEFLFKKKKVYFLSADEINMP